MSDSENSNSDSKLTDEKESSADAVSETENSESNVRDEKKAHPLMSPPTEEDPITAALKKKAEEADLPESEAGPTATRHDLHFGRRIFHFSNGFIIATLYAMFLTHQKVVYIIGMGACLLYIFEQWRFAYPEMAKKISPAIKFLMRAEEQIKETSSMPYLMGLLLTIITFPKPVALVAIFTLAIADPLAAIVGIKFGQRKIVADKSLEGSGAFFISCTLVSVFVLTFFSGASVPTVVIASILIGLFSALFEMIPLKIDDNLTIPIFTGAITWIVCSAFAIAI